jgi:hypothetical protein
MGSSLSYTFTPNNGDMVYCIMNSNYPCRTANADTCNPLVVTVDAPAYPYVSISANPGYIVGIGDSITFTAVVTDAVNPIYQWYINGLPIAGATSSVFRSGNFSTTNQDSVSCIVTNTGICSVASQQWIYVYATSEGVQQIQTGASGIAIVPNPNNGSFTIKGTVGVNDEEVYLEVTDILGQTVYRNNVLALNGKLDERITLKSAANGMYILTLHTGEGNKVFHVVVTQ